MERAWAGHAFPGLELDSKTEILGYKTEASIDGFRHGIFLSDAVRTSIVKKRFLVFMKAAATACGEDKARKMIAELKNESLAEKISNTIRSMHAEHDQLIEKIDVIPSSRIGLGSVRLGLTTVLPTTRARSC